MELTATKGDNMELLQILNSFGRRPKKESREQKIDRINANYSMTVD